MLCFLAVFASAQVSAGNVFVGYSYQNSDLSALNLNLSRPAMQGWNASLEGKVFRYLGIVADLSGHYGTQSFTEFPPAGPGPINVNVTAHELEVMFGPRLSFPVGKWTPFAELMGGVGHTSTGGSAYGSSGPSDTSFATAIGGGLDYRLVRLVAVRVQGDYVATRFFGHTQNNLRLSTGIVFRF